MTKWPLDSTAGIFLKKKKKGIARQITEVDVVHVDKCGPIKPEQGPLRGAGVTHAWMSWLLYRVAVRQQIWPHEPDSPARQPPAGPPPTTSRVTAGAILSEMVEVFRLGAVFKVFGEILVPPYWKRGWPFASSYTYSLKVLFFAAQRVFLIPPNSQINLSPCQSTTGGGLVLPSRCQGDFLCGVAQHLLSTSW